MTGSPPSVPPLADLVPLAGALRLLGAPAPSVALVRDDGPAMAVWDPTADAFQRVLETVCADVRVYSLRSFREGRTTPSAPAGRLVLVLTDGLDDFWAGRSAATLMRSWARTAPVAILDPYPEHRWNRSSLGLRKLQVRAAGPLAPNATLGVREPTRWRDPFVPALTDSVVVPVLELTPDWLRWWAGLVTGRADDWLDGVGYAADPDLAVGVVPPVVASGGAARDLVDRFRHAVPPLAFRLATYAAAAPFDLPVLRAVQGTMLPGSQPFHLAEVVTSPLLVTGGRAGPAGTPGPDFRDGVRAALLAHAGREETVRVVEVVADLPGDRAPAARTLLRAIGEPDGVPDTPVTPDTLPYVPVEIAVLRALSGPYARRAGRMRAALAAFRGDPPVAAGPIEPGRGSAPMPGNPAPELAPDGPPGDPYSISSLLGSRERSTRRAAVWGNVPPRNPDFTGRDQTLAALDERLRTRSVTAVLPQALHGMGGVGKSQIAAEYAYRHSADYDVVWWVPSEQPAQILRALVELGETLGLGVGLEANTAVPAVREALRAGRPYANWLLIFDNAETLDTVQPYLPRGGTGKVLVTSRNDQWSAVAEALEIDVFSREESIQLLRKHNADITVGEADRLAEILGDLPLAIGQATAWRAATHMPIDEYLRLLAEKRVELAGRATAPEFEIAVATAWSVALDRLGQENPAALQVLQACSFLAPEPITRELFLGPRSAPITPELDATLQDPSRLNQALRDIQRYGLARIDYRDHSVQLHRLVKTVLVSRLSTREQVRMEHAAHLLLAGGNPGSPDLTNHWPRYHALLPHVVASDAAGCEDPWTRQLVLDIIGFQFYWGDHVGCRDLAEEVVSRWRGMLGPDDLQTLKAARWLGFVRRQLGDFEQATEINADSLRRLRATRGPEDEETLDAMVLVAADSRAAGDFLAARTMDETAYRSGHGVFGPDYPTTLIVAHSLGVSLRLNGDFRAALALDADTSRRRTEVLGANHPLTLLTLNGLTLDVREFGRYLQAHTEQEALYERIHDVLGEEHPQTLMAARNLAVAKRRAGEHESARKLAQHTMTVFGRRFGLLHPDTIASTLNYAVDLREDDKLEESRALAAQACDEYHRTLGHRHPYTLYARTNLGIVLRLLGRVDESYEHDAAAYRGLRERLGPDHVLALTCAVNLASDLAARGEHDAAYELDSSTLRRSTGQLGAEHPSTLACALNLAFDLAGLGRRAESAELFRRTLDGLRRVLGPQHPAIVAAQARERANCDVDPMPL